MKKVIIAVAMLFAVSASFAQAETRAGSTRKQVTAVKTDAEKSQELESFITKLNATSEQAAKIRTFYKEFNAEKANLEAAKTPEYKAQIRAIGEAYANKLRAILTPEQKKTFEAVIAERENK